jgi:hypothetical protein
MNDVGKLNRRTSKPSATGFRGATRAHKGLYKASIRLEGKLIHFGHFASARAAAEAFDARARKEFGKAAWLNFPRRGEQRGLVSRADEGRCAFGHRFDKNSLCRICRAAACARWRKRRRRG